MIKQIPMLDLQLEYQYMKVDIDAAIKKCLEHQKWILGPEVEELENKIAKYLDVKHCIGASSGTEALVLSLRAITVNRHWSPVLPVLSVFIYLKDCLNVVIML